MAPSHAIYQLSELSHSFGREAAARKLELTRAIAELRRVSGRRILVLQDTLSFMRAYPDNAAVLDAVNTLIALLPDIVRRQTGDNPLDDGLINSGLRGTANMNVYSYAVLRHIARLFPGTLTLSWDDIDEIPPRVDALNFTVLWAESRGLEDEYLSLQQWVEQYASRDDETDLEAVLGLFQRSGLNERQQMHLFETAGFPVVYSLAVPGTARCDGLHPVRDIHYHTRLLPRDRFPLAPRVRAPLTSHRRLDPGEGRAILDMSLSVLTSRNLEIHPLMYGNDRDVTIVDGERGLQVVLAGMLPEFRQPIESDHFFLVMKNGVPIAYGPASMFLGCCEMGINLFTEFRRAEIRRIYALVMQSLYHLLAGRYFFVTSYGMGELNPEALRSGAFWFYRKLGFRAANPDVEALAREEEAIMRRRPGHRSSMATLRELSHTDAYFDLSRGAITPLNFERLGLAVTRFVTHEFNGDRRRAKRVCTERVCETLGIVDLGSWRAGERNALQRIAPTLALLSDLPRWPAREKQALAQAVRAKGGRSESDYLKLLGRVPRLAEVMHAAADPVG